MGWLYTDKHQFCRSSRQSRNSPNLAGHTKYGRQRGHKKQSGVL